MKVALASAKIKDRDVSGNLQQMEQYMREAKKANADIVCFGEAFLQGFNALSWDYDVDNKIALKIDSCEINRIRELTVDIGIDVMFGFNEIDGEDIYSSCALISMGEIVQNYRRVSRGWKEYTKTDFHYKEGQSVHVFEYRCRKCLIALCGDLWDMPHRFSLGEEILFWPVYVSWTKEEWENGGKTEYCEQAKLCCKNTLYVNSVCEGDAFGGACHFENGSIKRELPILNEGMLITEVRQEE